MKLRLPLSVIAMLITLYAASQTPVNQAFAITSARKGSFQWTEVKLIDLKNGSVVSNVFQNNKSQYNVFNGRTSKQIALKVEDSASKDRPFAGLSAACAYDKKKNRLYFVPLFINQLRYIDLGASVPSVYNFENEPFSKNGDMDVEANQITRMAIASDGNGYALNNDGSHLIRFTTGDYPVVTDLGALQNGPANSEVLIEDANTSWGGDMVPDAAGNLYLITALNHVFKIDLQLKTANYIQEIKGLPIGYTTNGAVVDADGHLVLSSANSISSYYNVDPSTWVATAITSNEDVFNTSDLANENVLFKTQLTEVKTGNPVNPINPVSPAGPVSSASPATPGFTAENIAVYPNPVKENFFRVTFSNKPSGNYNVQLVDIAGRLVADKAVVVSNSGQVSEVKIDPALARGMYMVKVMNHENKALFIKKIVVQ